MLRIVLIAHDDKKAELLKWLETRRSEIAGADLFATWSTADGIRSGLGLPVSPIGSDPAAADGRIGRMIEEGIVDLVVFLWDPHSARPHEVDADALLRLACDHGVPTALNPWTADYFLSGLVGKGGWRRVRVPSEERPKRIA